VDKKYWNKYYKSNYKPFVQSNFSEFVVEALAAESSIIDIGCGNGRDSIFFANQKFKTTGIDQSIVAIENLKKYENEYLKFKTLSFSELKNGDKFDYAYCRFIFHSINELEEDSLLHWLRNNVSKNIFIEARVDIDQEKYMKTNHYRRLMNIEEFSKKLKKIGFVIISSEISDKFSIYSKKYRVEDIKFNPILARLVIKNS